METMVLAEETGLGPTPEGPAWRAAGALVRLLRRVWRGVKWCAEWLFGLFALVVGLSLLAALPVAQFLCLGYLLESSGRVAKSGRMRDGLIGVRRAAHVGGLLAGGGLSLVPLGLVRSYAGSASLVDPGGPIDFGWRLAAVIVAVSTFLHLIAACARGGRFRDFLWPVGSVMWYMRLRGMRGVYGSMRDRLWSFVSEPRFPRYFRIGLVGFLGTLVWLAPPALLIAAGGRVPPVGFVGALLLAMVVPFLPFLQVRYVVEDRWRALFEVRGVRDRFKRAPWAFAVSLMALLLAAIPLYLLKIEMVPQEAGWLPALVFVVFLAPARILTGWAYARAGRRDQPRHWFFRIVGRLAIIPAAVLYVLVVFLSQYTSWNGTASLFEQHAFLLPVPILGN